MIRDYAVSGLHESPVRYAENYYFHYPKVAFGVWGPLLQFIEAGWLLVFPASHVSMLFLMALITALTATLLYLVLVGETGGVLAAVAGLLFVTAPIVQDGTGMIMADGLVALLDFCAALVFARYLAFGDWRRSALFGLLASLSILTKTNGLALGLLPLFAIVFTRRFSVLKQWSLWMAVAIVICLAGPWQLYSTRIVDRMLDLKPGWSFAASYTTSIAGIAGIALLPLIFLGLYNRVAAPLAQGAAGEKWASSAALICSVWVFHLIAPMVATEPRYLLGALPPMLMFLAAGAGEISRYVTLPSLRRGKEWIVAGLVCAVFFGTAFKVTHKKYHGFDEVADRLEGPEFRDSAILVSSEADGEGMLISEMAMREQRPLHVILRATKVLSQSKWLGEQYRLLYSTPQEVMAFLDSVPVELVVIHNEPGITVPHHALLQQTIAAFPDLWALIGTYPSKRTAPQSSIDVFRLKSAAGRHPGKIRIDLPYTLGHSIER